MLYLYRRAASESARELAEALTVNCRRLNDLGRAHFGHGVRAGDTVVCWGEQLNPIRGVTILNGATMRNKMQDAQVLRAAGVATVEVSATRPADVAANDVFVNVGGELTRAQVQERILRLQRFLATPVAVPATWLPRRFNHIGGADLLHPPTAPDFYSKKVDIKEEYRIHSFKGKSIRAGVKVHRDGVAAPHAWIRSYDGGWRVRYDEFKSKESMRQIAAAACTALGLDFGAVDIGRKADKSLIVLEVNRAPGIEGGTTQTYANAIQNWLEEGE